MSSDTRPRMVGTTDEVTTCDCCGKSNLKHTVMISLDGESDPVHFGSTCAARTLRGMGYALKGSQIATQAEKLDSVNRMLASARSNLAQYQAMIAAGCVRYVIGGVERGALLAELVDSRMRDIKSYEVKATQLGVLA